MEQQQIALDDPMYEPKQMMARFLAQFGQHLLPEQQRHVDRLLKIVYVAGSGLDVSQMGYGKTRCALAVAAALGYNVVLIGPGNSEAVFRQDAMLYGVHIKAAYTYEKFAGQGQKDPYKLNEKGQKATLENGPISHGLLWKTTTYSEKTKKKTVSFSVPLTADQAYAVFNNTLVIVDEIHKMKRGSTQKAKAVTAFLNFMMDYRNLNIGAVKCGVLMLSGTPYDKVEFAETFLRAVNISTAAKNYDVINNSLEYYRGPNGEEYGLGQAIKRAKILEQAVAQGLLTSANEQDPISGVTDRLIRTYIEGDTSVTSESKRRSLREVITRSRPGASKDTSRRSTIEQIIDNFYHEFISRLFLPILGDAIQPKRVNKKKQRRITRFIPLRDLNFGGVIEKAEDRIRKMDELILKFAQLLASLPRNPAAIGEVGKTLSNIQNEMMFDVAYTVRDKLAEINGQPEVGGKFSKCIIFTTWLDGVAIAEQAFASMGIPVLTLSGKIPAAKRSGVMNQFMDISSFQAAMMYRVIIVTLGTGAEAISLDDRTQGGMLPRFSFILPNYSITQLHQAASRQERITTTSEGDVYNIYPQTRNELLSIVNAIARKTVVLEFVSLTSEIEYPGTYDIQVDPASAEYVNLTRNAPYRDPEYAAKVKSGVIAYEAFKDKNDQSALTADEVLAAFQSNAIESVTAGVFGNDPTAGEEEEGEEEDGTPRKKRARAQRGTGAITTVEVQQLPVQAALNPMGLPSTVALPSLPQVSAPLGAPPMQQLSAVQPFRQVTPPMQQLPPMQLPSITPPMQQLPPMQPFGQITPPMQLPSITPPMQQLPPMQPFGQVPPLQQITTQQFAPPQQIAPPPTFTPSLTMPTNPSPQAQIQPPISSIQPSNSFVPPLSTTSTKVVSETLPPLGGQTLAPLGGQTLAPLGGQQVTLPGAQPTPFLLAGYTSSQTNQPLSLAGYPIGEIVEEEGENSDVEETIEYDVESESE